MDNQGMGDMGPGLSMLFLGAVSGALMMFIIMSILR